MRTEMKAVKVLVAGAVGLVFLWSLTRGSWRTSPDVVIEPRVKDAQRTEDSAGSLDPIGAKQTTRLPVSNDDSASDGAARWVALLADGQSVDSGRLFVTPRDGDEESCIEWTGGSFLARGEALHDSARLRAVIDGTEHVAVSLGMLPDDSAGEWLSAIVLTTTTAVPVRVVSSMGVGVAARVTLDVHVEWSKRLQDVGYVEVRGLSLEQELILGAQGSGRIASVPKDCPYSIAASAKGYEWREVSRAEFLEASGVITLYPIGTRAVICGVVLAQDGSPVRQAQVRLGRRGVMSGEDGSFCVVAESLEPNDCLVSYHPAFGGAELAGPELVAAVSSQGVNRVELHLQSMDSKLSGLVLDAEGSPLRGARVVLREGLRWDALSIRCAERALEGFPDRPWIEPGSDGAFTFRRVLPHEYYLVVVQSSTLHVSEHGPFLPDGADAICRVEMDLHDVSGVVVDKHGTGVPGLEVFLGPSETCWKFFEGTGRSRRTRSDVGGTFQFLKVDTAIAVVSVEDGEASQPLRGGGERSIVLVVDPECEFVIGNTGYGLADSFELLDSIGNPMLVSWKNAEGEVSAARRVYLDGDPQARRVYSARQSSSFLVLLANQSELARFNLELRSGERVIVGDGK
jgi:hypothetical protein